MDVLGQGHKGIVIGDGSGSVKKFYLSKKEWEDEKTNLRFLKEIERQGFNTGCKIPELIDSGKVRAQEINGKTYSYYSIMERIFGRPAHVCLNGDMADLGASLAGVLFLLHSQSETYVSRWTDRFGTGDRLLTHILKDKAGKVIAEETDQKIVRYVKKTSYYLEKSESLQSRRTLSHLDLNLSNALVGRNSNVEGLVDWGSFGLTHPSLSLYQLVTEPRVWVHIEEGYEALGGIINHGVLYAAAVIHMAWTPLICRELGLEFGENETRLQLEKMYASFNIYKEI